MSLVSLVILNIYSGFDLFAITKKKTQKKPEAGTVSRALSNRRQRCPVTYIYSDSGSKTEGGKRRGGIERKNLQTKEK